MSAPVKTNGYVGTILLDFPADAKTCTDFMSNELENGVASILAKKFGPLFVAYVGRPSPDFGRVFLFVSGEKGVTIQLRTYPKRSYVTCTIEYDLQQFNGKAPLTFIEIGEMEGQLAKAFSGAKKTSPIPQIKRALDFDCYYTTSDGRLLEYDFQEILFDEQSEWQRVQIGRSTNYGNTLILDGLVNLADSDLAYSETIMCRGQIDYTGKDVLILGGGDGGLLYELRKEKCKSIAMIEIDDVVMKACKVHLRAVCGDTLDKYKHENYEIIVGDCIPFMEKCKMEGKKFDYIFGDLTDIPISTNPNEEVWDFFKTTLQLSFAILKKDGSYLTHANGITAAQSLDMFEKTIRASLNFPLDFKKSYAFVPSFQEKWVFYQVKRAN